MMQSVKRRRLWEMDAELRKEWNYVKQNSPVSSFERKNVREESILLRRIHTRTFSQSSRVHVRQTL